MSVTLSVSPQYISYPSTQEITLTATGSFPSPYTQYSYEFQLSGSTTAGVVLSVENLKTVKFNISDIMSMTDYNNGVSEIEFEVRGYNPSSGIEWSRPSNTVKLYIARPLSTPIIQSITPKSPKITETLRIIWGEVDKADYYTVTAAWRSVGGSSSSGETYYRGKIVRDNISAASFSGDPYIDTCPAQYTDGQYGYLWYNVTAKSNDPRYTSCTSEYYIVNLNLASNLRYKSAGGWIRGKPYIKVGGAWHRAVKTYVKTNGVWKNA